MPRKQIQLMEWDELSKLDHSALIKRRNELRKLTWQRISRLKKAGLLYSPAATALVKKMNAGKITPFAPTGKRKELPQTTMDIKIEIQHYQAFLVGKTSTVSGAKKWDIQTADRLGEAYATASLNIKRKYWELYEIKRSEIEELELRGASERIQKELVEKFIGMGRKYITAKRKEEFEKMVEREWDRAHSDLSDHWYDTGLNWWGKKWKMAKEKKPPV